MSRRALWVEQDGGASRAGSLQHGAVHQAMAPLATGATASSSQIADILAAEVHLPTSEIREKLKGNN